MDLENNIILQSTAHQKPILTDVYFEKNNTKKPIVIFCHGYKGYKDWGAWNLVAEEFSKHNFFFLKFNFSHNGGTVENPIDFPDLEAFGQNNFTTELNDLEDVINWILNNEKYQNEIDCNNLTLIGHSRGGGVVTLKAAENKNVKQLITWAGVSDFGARFPSDKALAEWKEKGVSYITNARTNQQMPHYYQFYKDFKANEERFTIKNAVQKLKIPHLIVQGNSDDVVLSSEAENLHRWNNNSKLLLVDEMNHTLGSVQPWTKNKMPKHLAYVVKKSISFLK
ncbi:MAG TPA: alpha/beta hydrolase fold domain-containing protein [Flavobacteriaceae bacterium]|nr:alpha/beta hydrolase fold domain-containing protein [Flavobacteriaceae bacterium]